MGAEGFALLSLWGCAGGAEEIDVIPPEVAAERVTFATLQDLGSFLLRSSTRDERTNPRATVVRESSISLKWKDRDHWEFESLRDGKPVTHWLIYQATAWEALSGDPLTPRGDAEPLRAQLSLGWDAWEDIIALTGGRIVYGEGTEETVDGRVALRHDLTLEPPRADKRRPSRSLGDALEATSVSGTVWIDRVTSVRVLADVVATAASPVAEGAVPNRTRTLSVKLALTGLGQDPGVAVPPDPLSPQ